MPWFPDFANAAALARKETHDAGQADPAAQYIDALQHGDLDALEAVWPGDVVVLDPRAGEVRGHRRLRAFVHSNQRWLAERHARIEVVAATRVPGRAVLELLARLTGHDGVEVVWPVAVVAEPVDERSVVFRTYCSQWPVDGRRHVRPPILEADVVALPGIARQYLAALSGADVAVLREMFAADGYVRESLGTRLVHRGGPELEAYFRTLVGSKGLELQPCLVTDDGTRCAVEYNCVGWGGHDVPPQAGLVVLERGPGGALAAVRQYDDVDQPVA